MFASSGGRRRKQSSECRWKGRGRGCCGLKPLSQPAQRAVLAEQNNKVNGDSPGRHPLPLTPKTITMVGAQRAAARSAARPFPCTSHAPTAQGEFPPLWGWQGELAGSQAWLGARAGDAAAGEARLSFQALSAGGPGRHRSAPAAWHAPTLTSYSWENFSPSLAFSLSMLSARSVTGMGGWSRMPASETRREEGEENGYGSARLRKARQQHVHSKPARWVQGRHV